MGARLGRCGEGTVSACVCVSAWCPVAPCVPGTRCSRHTQLVVHHTQSACRQVRTSHTVPPCHAPPCPPFPPSPCVQVDIEGEDHFRPMGLKAPATTALTNIPCGICPVFSECRDDGIVSPQTCEYFNKWLQF